MALRTLLNVITGHLSEIRKAMNEIGIKTDVGVDLKDWDDLIRTLNDGAGTTLNKIRSDHTVGDLHALFDSLVDLRQAINDTGTDEIERGIPLEDWADYIRWLIENRTGCKSYTVLSGTQLGDISIAPRRLLLNRYPDRFYYAYTEGGVVKVNHTPYTGDFSEEWEAGTPIGTGNQCALAFDGYWRRTGESLYLLTHESPYVFWVDGSNSLWKQLWMDSGTKELLAENVTYIKAIRAWKNFSFPDQDNGVIVAYIKTDGKVYYRTWAEQSNGVYMWELEEELVDFTGTASSLNLFITNDYRTGITVEDTSGNVHWFITGRNWAGVAIADHKLTVSSSIAYQMYDILYSDFHEREKIVVASEIIHALEYAGLINSFIEVYNEEFEGDWGRILNVQFEHRMFDLSNADITLVDSKAVEYNPLTVTRIDDRNYRLEFFNFHNIGDEGTIKFNGISGKNIINNLYLPFEDVFYPINLEPVLAGPPEVEVIWNE